MHVSVTTPPSAYEISSAHLLTSSRQDVSSTSSNEATPLAAGI
jgi:hypothetical protein